MLQEATSWVLMFSLEVRRRKKKKKSQCKSHHYSSSHTQAHKYKRTKITVYANCNFPQLQCTQKSYSAMSKGVMQVQRSCMLRDQATAQRTFPFNQNNPKVLPLLAGGENKCLCLDKLQRDAVMAIHVVAAPGMRKVCIRSRV